nr:type VI secretion system baseplate subunit TssF [Gemmatimonadaceae bacterium]
MRDELLEYYERELTYLRRMGADFARRYPKVAGRLQLEPTKADDPHVERLLEGVAFLAARVHRRIDDDLPELAHTLLDVVHPHYVRPIPAATIARFHLDPEQGVLTDGLPVAKGTQLYTRAAAGERCRFRT